MTEELITRAYLADAGRFPAGWMAKSGQRVTRAVGLKAVEEVIGGIQFYAHGTEGRVVRLDLAVQDAEDLRRALDLHLENLAPAPRPDLDRGPETTRAAPDSREEESRRRDSSAAREQAAERGAVLTTGEIMEAMADVADAWTNNGPSAVANHGPRMEGVRAWFPALAEALDRLAALTA